jgi:hypothetical protein
VKRFYGTERWYGVTGIYVTGCNWIYWITVSFIGSDMHE